MPPGPVPVQPLTGRLGTAGLTPADVRRKAHARLAERIDVTRSRHKPISLLRQEARRILDLFLELEVPLWPKADRDKLADDVIGEALGLGPLDELFRDEAVLEFMILAHNQVIARRGDVWMPTSVHFKDADQYRKALARLAEQGEPLFPGPQPSAAVDTRLPNGFRLVAVLPPAVLEQAPVAVFVRGVAPAAPAPGKSSSGVVPLATGRSSADIALNGSTSGKWKGIDSAGPASGKLKPAPAPAPSPLPPMSGTVSFAGGRGSGTVSAQTSTRMRDPMLWVRERVTDRLSKKLAAVGVYDVGQIPGPELHKVVVLLVVEFCEQEKLGVDAAACDQLALEILAGMRR